MRGGAFIGGQAKRSSSAITHHSSSVMSSRTVVPACTRGPSSPRAGLCALAAPLAGRTAGQPPTRRLGGCGAREPGVKPSRIVETPESRRGGERLHSREESTEPGGACGTSANTSEARVRARVRRYPHPGATMSEPLTTSELLRQLAGAKTGGSTESIARLRARTDLVEAARAALSGGQEVERVLVLLAMRGLESREAQELMLSSLGDASAQVRAMAARGLALAPRQVAWGRLVQALADVDSTVRRQALETLVRIDTSAAGALLGERFAHATESERLTLLEVASEEATPEWLPLARQGLADATPAIRAAAVDAMAALEGPSADHALMAALQDVDEQVRVAAVEALTPRDTLLEEPFLALLADVSPAVRMRALQALLRRGTTEGVEALIPLLEDPVPQLRKLAILAIGQLGCGAAIPRLIDEARRATDEEERASLVTALGALGAREGEPVLQAALQDTSALVRSSAVVAWPRIVGTSRALVPLRGLLRGDPDWQ